MSFCHDPFYGPSRCIPHAEFMEAMASEVSPTRKLPGSTLIAIAAGPDHPARLPAGLCATVPPPPAVAGPRCKERVALEPSQALGCIATAPASRACGNCRCLSAPFATAASR